MKQDHSQQSVPAIEEMPEEIFAAEPSADAALTGDEIRERMVTVRQKIQERSDEVVVQTKVLSDWRFYFRLRPWASVTAAAVIGYAIVPKRAKNGAGDSTQDIDDQPATSKASELKSLLVGVAKRAAVAQVKRTLSDVLSGFLPPTKNVTGEGRRWR